MKFRNFEAIEAKEKEGGSESERTIVCVNDGGIGTVEGAQGDDTLQSRHHETSILS